MSKLAAICAKLKGDAVAVNDLTAEVGQAATESSPPISPTQAASILAEDATHFASFEAPSFSEDSPLLGTPDAPDIQGGGDAGIGALKRKSIMPSASGASRRKMQRPTLSSAYDQLASAPIEDNQSVDGSEHSLHIDLPEDQGAKSTEAGHTSPFQQYTSKSAASSNPGVLQALGLTGIPTDAFGSIMASQSLAALAQQAKSFKMEPKEPARTASPGSVSGDSLNESQAKRSLSEKQGSGGKKKKPLDCTKYLTRYSNAQECGSSHCIGMNYREHFHCLDCTSRVIVKKEEMVRHYKWHKKREDSLQHGFMRYSPFDDCTVKFGPCAHNQKQTHYHCIQSGCNKVYVSTSDVQMHANYHRKASAIIMEGFQRFRATEDCGTPNCDFYSQRTTHFHCRRQGCNFTFKNKADMEKHKTYHQKDEILTKDGFKKYMKYEHCPYQGCAYSKLSNHIHCMRPGCQYVLHSTSQLYPHKRKHVKKETDPFANFSSSMADDVKKELSMLNKSAPATSGVNAVTDIPPPQLTPAPSATMASELLSNVARLSQGLMPVLSEGGSKGEPLPIDVKGEKTVPVNPFDPASQSASPATHGQMEGANDDEEASDSLSNHSSEQVFDKSLNLTPGRVLEPAAMNWKTERSSRLTDHAKSMMGHFKIASGGGEPDTGLSPVNKNISIASAVSGATGSGEKQSELWKKYLTRYTANDPCNPRCWLLYKDHYHCNVENCFNAFKNKDGVRDHARLHDNQVKISEQLFTEFSANQACPVEGCEYSGSVTHFHCKWMNCTKTIPLDEDIFARLDHFQEHEFAARMNQTTARRTNSTSIPAGFKSFNKKRGRPPKTMSAFPGMLPEDLGYHEQVSRRAYPPKDSLVNYSKFDESMPCYDDLCKFKKEVHYHCNIARCHTATNRLDVMQVHSINFHSYIQIPENYAYFDRNVNCRGVHCSNNRNSCHYHCLRPGCEHSFIRHTTVTQHDKKHKEEMKPTAIQHPLAGFVSGAGGDMGADSAADDPYSQQSVALFTELNRMRQNQARAEPRHEDDLSRQHLSAATSSKTVKASGTFFPQAGKPDESAAVEAHDESSNSSSSGEEQTAELAPARVPQYPPQPQIPSMPPNTQATAMLNLLAQMTMFIQQKATHNQQSQLHAQLQAQQAPPPAADEQGDTWQKMLGRMYASPQLPCSNVFCKKKQMEHYHCLQCGTAFNKNHEVKLKAHMDKHSKYSNHLAASKVRMDKPSAETNPVFSPPLAMSGINSMLMEAMAQQQQQLGKKAAPAAAAASAAVGESSSATRVGVPDSSTDEMATPSSSIQDVMMKALQLQVIGNGRHDGASDHTADNQSMSQSDREETENEMDSACDEDKTTPNDYLYQKFSSNRDCGYSKCLHSKNCEHYHCPREGCAYGVTEPHRLMQHIGRHEKLDQVMGDDFKLFKPHNDCNRADCEFVNKVSHFHCQRCPYICTDANRILPHRKNHTNTTISPQSNSIFNVASDLAM